MQSSSLFYKYCAAVALLILLAVQGNAQSHTFVPPGTRSVHVYTDVYKTNYERPFRKLQAGFEVGYQLNSKVSITGGLELWNNEPTPMITLGNRFYPFGPTFVRYRALIGKTADVALGFGYSFRIKEHFLLEAASDYYLDEGEIGFRLGLGYRWTKN